MNPAQQSNDSPEAASQRCESSSLTLHVMKGEGGNVNKIRDILFGFQIRDYETRFAALEATLA